MAFLCPHCQCVAYTRSSRYLSEVTQEEYFQCTNIVCSHTFSTIREARETLSPSATPNPRVHLPQASRAKLAALRIAMRMDKDKDKDQIPLALETDS